MAFSLESCDLKRACFAARGSEKLLFDLRDELRRWIKLQPHLPQDIPEYLLDYLILGTKMSLERAKQKLDMVYTIKRHIPEFFANRDPLSPNLDEMRKMMHIVCLPKLTPEGYGITIIRPIADDFSKFVAADSLKYWAMLSEIKIRESRILGDITIFDLAKATFSMMTKYSPILVKKFEVTGTEAYASRIKAIHLLNAGRITDSFLGLYKSVLKPKIAARIHVHLPGNYESLHQVIPKSILPKDYGGDEISMADLSDKWCAKTHEYRDWFFEQEKLVVDERLRPGPAIDDNSLFGFSGSFRKLDVD